MSVVPYVKGPERRRKDRRRQNPPRKHKPSWGTIHARGMAEQLGFMPNEEKHTSVMSASLPAGFHLYRASSSSFGAKKYIYILYRHGHRVAAFGNAWDAKAYAKHVARAKTREAVAKKVAKTIYNDPSVIKKTARRVRRIFK